MAEKDTRAAAASVTPKTLIEKSFIWFVLGVLVAAVVGTISGLAWLEDFVDSRVARIGPSAESVASEIIADPKKRALLAVGISSTIASDYIDDAIADWVKNNPIEVSPEKVRQAIIEDPDAVEKLKGDKGAAGVTPDVRTVSRELTNDKEFISALTRLPQFAEYVAKALISHHRDMITPIPPSADAIAVSLYSQFKDQMTRVSAADTPHIPSGAVVAFATRNGCSIDGWSTFEEARGRFILGSDGSDAQLIRETSFGLEFPRGGEDSVRLKPANLPAHVHNTPTSTSPDTSVAGYKNIGGGELIDDHKNHATVPNPRIDGEAKPHNNMPPYVVLYFCKKN